MTHHHDHSDDSTPSLPHNEHDEILADAIVAWRRIAETIGVPVNGPDACEAIDILMHAMYDQRDAALDFATSLLGDLSAHEDIEADECRGDVVNFSPERMALARERSAAFETAGAIIYNHKKEMTEGHVHFDEANAEKIKDMSDEIIDGGEKPEKSN